MDYTSSSSQTRWQRGFGKVGRIYDPTGLKVARAPALPKNRILFTWFYRKCRREYTATRWREGHWIFHPRPGLLETMGEENVSLRERDRENRTRSTPSISTAIHTHTHRVGPENRTCLQPRSNPLLSTLFQLIKSIRRIVRQSFSLCIMWAFGVILPLRRYILLDFQAQRRKSLWETTEGADVMDDVGRRRLNWAGETEDGPDTWNRYRDGERTKSAYQPRRLGGGRRKINKRGSSTTWRNENQSIVAVAPLWRGF